MPKDQAEQRASVEEGTLDELRKSIQDEQEAVQSKEAEEDSGTSEEVEESSESEEETEENSKTSDWALQGRFKTASELAQAYRNLEGEYTRLRQMQTAQQKQQKEDPSKEVERLAKEDPIKAIRKAAGTDEAILEAKKLRVELEYNKLSQNPDFRNLEPEMNQLAQEYGDMIVSNNLDTDPRLLHVLYYMAQGRKATALAQKAEKAGQTKGEKTAIKKMKAQVEGGSSRGTSTKKSNFEDLSLADMRKELLKAEAS